MMNVLNMMCSEINYDMNFSVCNINFFELNVIRKTTGLGKKFSLA